MLCTGADNFENRVFRDKLNPLDVYADIELFESFRFGRIEILKIVEEICGDLTFGYRRKGYLSPELQVGEGGGHDRTVKVKRPVARELCTPGL